MEEYLQIFLNYTLVSTALAAILAPAIINLLYKMGVIVQHLRTKGDWNAEFFKLQQHKSGTPTMGGFIIAIPVILLTLVLIPASPLRSVFLTGFAVFSVYGFIDELLVKINKNNKEFRLLQESFLWRLGKIILMAIIGTSLAYAISAFLGITEITLFGDISIPFAGVFLVGWGLVAVFGTYAAEVTDGLDGLVTGLFLAAYMAYLAIIVLTDSTELTPYVGLIVGASIVYLYFNITPARVFMGGVGAMPLGFVLLFLAILTDTLVPYFIITSVFWIEEASSVIQVISIRFFKTKVFRIAPLHHHFESIGWSEAKIVQRFWLFGGIAAVLGVWVFMSFV